MPMLVLVLWCGVPCVCSALCCVAGRVSCRVVSGVVLIVRSCVLDGHHCVAGCVCLCGEKKTLSHVNDGSKKNTICNRTQITPQRNFLHYGLN